MKARARKAIDRLLTRAIPTAPTESNWFTMLNDLRFRTLMAAKRFARHAPCS
jgi:hypothetical protein